MTLAAQYMTLMVMSLNGAILGAVYDMYRVILRHWKFLRWASPILDFAFWIFSFAVVFWSLMWANNGDLRIYVFVVLGLGLLIYRIFLQRIVVGSTIGIIMGIRYVCIQLYRAFMALVVRPVMTFVRLFISLCKVIDRILQSLERVILWPFKPLGKILLWIGKQIIGLLLFITGPLRRLTAPYIQRIANRIKPVVKPAIIQLKWFVKKGKGIWLKVANWLLNRDDDDKPKP